MTATTVPLFVSETLCALGLGLDDHQLHLMAQFIDQLLETNQRINLTAIRDRDEAWRRHIIDSLTLLPALDSISPQYVVDVGSGGGVPGLPLAISRPQVQVTLVEATSKKARFCAQCVQSLSLENVRVVADRAETLGHQPAHRQRYDAAVCRAIGAMRTLVEYTLPLVRIGGHVFAMKGQGAESELEAAADAMHQLGAGELQVHDAYPREMDIHTVIVSIEKRQATPPQYPRLPGVPARDPL